MALDRIINKQVEENRKGGREEWREREGEKKEGRKGREVKVDGGSVKMET